MLNHRLDLSSMVALALMGLAACGGSPPPNVGQKQSEPALDPLRSNDVMAREPRVTRATVKHILIGWQDLTDVYKGGIDPRAATRSSEQAEGLVAQLRDRATAGESFDALMAQYSEDGGSARRGGTYEVFPGSKHVFEFRRMGIRLDVGEVGVARSIFGWHIMLRTE